MKSFLILGYPRSGTKYIYQLMRQSLGHENISMEETDYIDRGTSSCVGWDMVKYHEKFDVIFHQTRNFYDIINSAKTMKQESLDRLSELYGKTISPIDDDNFYNSVMDSWLAFNAKVASLNHEITYRVEDLNSALLSDILKRIDVKYVDTNAINRSLKIIKPKNNSRKRDKRYSRIDRIEFLKNLDKKRYKKLKKSLTKYGYEI